MDAKTLRAAMKDKAKRLATSSPAKVDSSTFTPAEPLNTEVKTGMRPISRRAFKTGGKVEGMECAPRADRKPRMNGGKIGLANTDQKSANEERDGKKHVGALKTGGRVAKNNGGDAEGEKAGLNHYEPLPKPKGNPFKPDQDQIDAGNALMQEEQRRQGDMTRRKDGGKTMKANGGATSCAGPDAGGREAKKKGGKAMGGAMAQAAGKDMMPMGVIPQMMMKKKKGGMVEGSKKDVAEDKMLAKKHGMSMKEWEASPEDKKHDAPKKKNGGGLYANIHAKRERIEDGSKEKMRKPGSKGAPTAGAFKASARTARKDGGKVGKTNINIIISPRGEAKEGMMPPQPMPMPRPPMPMPAAAAAPPMPMPAPGGMPPGLGAALAGAANVAPPGGAMPGRPPMPMARKDGGKVYPKMKYGAGSGEGRLEKIEKYGKNAKP
jgi:hypothetical protein